MQSHRHSLSPAMGAHPLEALPPQITARPVNKNTPIDPPPAAGPHLMAFEAATPIQTPSGVRRVDALCAGDWVLTRSGTSVPILSIDTIHLTAKQLHEAPNSAPIRFDPGALPDMPEAEAVLLAPDLPITWSPEPGTAIGAHYPARAFCDGGLIRWVIPAEGVRYIRLHLADPQQICAGGIWVVLNETQETDRSIAHVPVPVPAPSRRNDIRVFRPLLF